MPISLLIELIRRFGKKSPKMFKYVQILSYLTILVCGSILVLSEYGLLVYANQDKWEELLKVLVYSGAGSAGTAHLTTEDEVKSPE